MRLSFRIILSFWLLAPLAGCGTGAKGDPWAGDDFKMCELYNNCGKGE